MPNPSGRLDMGHKPSNYYLSVPLVKLSNIANKEPSIHPKGGFWMHKEGYKEHTKILRG